VAGVGFGHFEGEEEWFHFYGIRFEGGSGGGTW
jgi:hypothetical protein